MANTILYLTLGDYDVDVRILAGGGNLSRDPADALDWAVTGLWNTYTGEPAAARELSDWVAENEDEINDIVHDNLGGY